MGVFINIKSIIREHCIECVVVFNELYEQDYSKWNTALSESQGFYNVVLDVHLYDWQEPYTSESVSRHVEDAKQWKDTLNVSVLFASWNVCVCVCVLYLFLARFVLAYIIVNVLLIVSNSSIFTVIAV